MNRFGLIILFIALSTPVFSQLFESSSYDWEKSPIYIESDIYQSKLNTYALFDKQIVEYAETPGAGDFFVLQTVHYKIRVNSETGIDDINKVFIPMYNVIDLVDVKARTIKKDGKVVEFNKDNIKTVENIENAGAFKLFAIEGVEKDAIVEVLYKIKKSLYLYGSNMIQKNYPVLNSSLEIISPEFLVFEAKCYNAKAKTEKKHKDNKRYLKLQIDTVLEKKEELYSAEKADFARIEFKFDKNTNNRNSDQMTYAIAAQRIFDNTYLTDEKQLKKIKKELSRITFTSEKVEDKIKTIERYLKNNYLIKEDFENKDVEEIEFIIKNKFSTESGFLKFAVNLFAVAGIEHQLVVTSNRFERKFDKDFMTWNYLSKALIYFPSTLSFLSPTDLEYRYPMVPNQFFNNYGLFLKRITIGDLVTVVPELKYIPANDAEKDYHNIDVKVSLSPDFSEVNIDGKISFAGHSAMFIYPFYHYIKPSEKEKVLDELVHYVVKGGQIASREVDEVDKDIPPTEKPFVLRFKLNSPTLLEKAGNNYLLSIGKLIGGQVEMYEKDKRVSPVEIPFVHSLNRKITLDIPAGYKVKGLESAKINRVFSPSGEKSCGFVSEYKEDTNKIEITITEYYNKIAYPLANYLNFREVINAAADFNKVVLVLEKI
jgi:hypothetical protein